MMRIGIALFVVLATFAVAGAEQRVFSFEHNGSLMSLEVFDNGRRDTPHHFDIIYENPRKGMRDEGVVPGTIFFEGDAFPDQTVVGTAYVFLGGCEPFPYKVSGKFTDKQHLVLHGPSPIVYEGCRVAGLRNYGPNTRLEFEFVSPQME